MEGTPRRATELLQRIGADISPDAEILSLSMPEQQLVEIACALGAGARIVIMDEPTASLTEKETGLLFAVIRDLRTSGVGVIYISHRLEEIFQLADRVTVLRDGESVGTRIVNSSNRDTVASKSDSTIQHGNDLTESELIKLMVGREFPRFFRPPKARRAKSFSLKNLGCSAGGAKNVSIEVRAGEILGLAGLVGAGRTELARDTFRHHARRCRRNISAR